MIVLNKKIIGIFAFALGFAFISDRKEGVPTVTLPALGKAIVIDVGLGKPDEGTESSNGTIEAETNYYLS